MGKKPRKEKIVDRQRAGREGRGKGTWSGNRNNPQASFMQGVQESISGIADNRGSGISNEGDINTIFKQGDNLPYSSWLIVVMVTDEFFTGNVKMFEQN